MSDVIEKAKNANIPSRYVKDAISSYMVENKKTKVKDTDIDAILNKLQKSLYNTKKRVEFTDDVKESIKEQVLEKMINDSKGLGFNTKDATALIRNVLGKENLQQNKPQNTNVINNKEINDLYDKIYKKIRDINTYDEVGKVKYKESLISINKALKDARKQ